jgi:hypothetical protein
MPDESETISNFKEAVRTISAALLLFTSICFVAGPLIVNIHLAKFGVRSPPLNRSEYVLVAVIFVLLVAASHFAINGTWDWIKVAAEDAKKKTWRTFFKTSFYALSAFIIPAFAPIEPRNNERAARPARHKRTTQCAKQRVFAEYSPLAFHLR